MSAQKNRVATGGRIDRSKPIRFTFDGKTYYGYEGDSLASALLANGVTLVGRSFKYHRPRGIISAGPEEPNALIEVGTGARREPNTRAPQIELYDGLVTASQNRWPSLDFDLGAVNSVMSRFLPSGFYYKTFKWPKDGWLFYEKFIRRMAGLGTGSQETDPDRYDKLYAHCDVMVVGAGPAGLAAALAAGRAGARVVLVDEQSELGGSLLSERERTIDGKPAAEWVATASAELASMPEVRVLTRTTAFAYLDANKQSCVERLTDHIAPSATGPRQRLWRIRAKEVILAAGSIERPLVYSDNDRPGCMLASAARTYVNRYGATPGQRVVIMTNNDTAYQTALDLTAAGVSVAAIVDLRANPTGALAQAARAKGIEIIENSAIIHVKGTKQVREVDVQSLTSDGKGVTGSVRHLYCDTVLSSGGWQPTVHLHSQTRAKVVWDDGIQAFVPGPIMPGQNNRSVGSARGAFGLNEALNEGHNAGAEAAAKFGFSNVTGNAPSAEAEPESQPLRSLWIVPSNVPVGQGGKHFVDYQNDVTAADVQLAHREGYVSVEHLKRYTTMGMATDQDQQRQRARDHGRPEERLDPGSRHDHLPSALHARDLRRVRGLG